MPDSAVSSKILQNISLNLHQAGIDLPTQIVKRDGRVVPFDVGRIENAMLRCFVSLGRFPLTPVSELAQGVVNAVAAKCQGQTPAVEGVQDVVEMVLQAAGEFEAAKHYILYRAEHAKQREMRPIPESVRQSFAESDGYFPSPVQKFQFYDKYSRFNYDLGRRETWAETVERSVAYLHELAGSAVSSQVYERIRRQILAMKSLPSMRLLAMAGAAARRNSISIYNCSYLPVADLDAFVEALLISMSGCGVGYSVEKKYVEQFPRVKRQNGKPPVLYCVEDSTEGWGESLRSGLQSWFGGEDVQFDLSKIREAGEPLKTKGGRASGRDPLRKMLDFVRGRILSRQGSFLHPIDAHDMMCAVGSAAVSGGVRRTAMISLFDFDDNEMRLCKSGDFERSNNQRWNANNSTVWPERPLTQAEVAHFMMDMVDSGRGEPGIFSRQAAVNTRPARRQSAEFGTNPCGEIVLRPYEFCNLSIAVARADDTFETLKEKVEIAAIIGTMQSLATHFPGLRSDWQRNCEEERLLGVDINGQLDSQVAQDAAIQRELKKVAVETNLRLAQDLGINPSVSVTCVKPSGNSSQLLDCSSGVHARWSNHYVRNARVGSHTPIFKVLKDSGVAMDPENGQEAATADAWVVHFPVKAPEGAVTRKDRSALAQLDYWLQVKENWTEHNPSATITYNPDEIIDVIKWVWAHQAIIGGLTFLPAFETQYDQMPYVEITEAEYQKLSQNFPEIDFAKIYRYEEEDLTTAAQELACLAGVCDILQ